MNIAMDVSIMAQCRTGTEEYTEGLVWGLNRIGLSVVGVGHRGQALLPDRPCLGIQAKSKRSPWAKLWWERWGVRRAIEKDVDLIHIPYMTHPPRRFQIPSVVTVHDLIPYRLDEYHSRARERAYFAQVRRNLRQASHLVAISQATLADIQSIMPDLAGRVSVIPNGIAPAYFLAADEDQRQHVARQLGLERRPRILYVGGYDVRKNVSTLIQAAREILRRHAGELVLVGAHDIASLKRQVHELGISDQVIATPWLSREDLVTLYQSCDIFAYPSVYEGFGMPPAQAMAAGTAVVAGDNPAVREVASNAAILVKPTDVDDWVSALTQVLENPALAERMVAIGKTRAGELAWDKVAARYQAVYESLVTA